MNNRFLSGIIFDSFWEKEKHDGGCLKMLHVMNCLKLPKPCDQTSSVDRGKSFRPVMRQFVDQRSMWRRLDAG